MFFTSSYYYSRCNQLIIFTTLVYLTLGTLIASAESQAVTSHKNCDNLCVTETLLINTLLRSSLGRLLLGYLHEGATLPCVPIVYPTNYATEYSIDCDLIQEVKRHAFAGTKDEDPQAHLMFFYTLCGTFKINDVSQEFVLLRLFKFTLKDKAEEWYNRLQYDNITSWKMCAEKFMAKFFPGSKIAKLRRNLTSFAQELRESLYAAWERYSKLLNLSPNNGFAEYVILH